MNKWRLCLIILVISGLIPFETALAESYTKENEAVFTFFSLPDGESMLITTSDKHILVNTGSKKSEKALQEQLDELKIKHIDSLILTTQESDVCANTQRLVKRYNINEVIVSESLRSNCYRHGNQRMFSTVKWKKGKHYELSPGLLFRVMKQDDSERMSLYITFGKTSILYMAEGNEAIEKQIEALPMQAEIIKIPEYASKNFPGVDFLQKIDPHIAIIYSIEEIPFNEALIERLSESWIDVYVLKKVGTIQIRSDLNNYEFMEISAHRVVSTYFKDGYGLGDKFLKLGSCTE